MGSLHATRPLSPPPSGIHNPASGVYSPNSVLCMARGGSPGPTPGWNLYPGPGMGTQAWGHQKRPRKCVSFPGHLGDSAGSLGELGSLGLLPPDSEEPCPGSSPQKSCAVHSAESSETCGWPRLCNDPIAGPWYQLQAFSLPSRQDLKGRMHRDLGCVKCVPAQSLGLGTKRGRGRRGTAQSVVLQGP